MGCPVKRRCAIRLRGIHIGALFDERPQRVPILSLGRVRGLWACGGIRGSLENNAEQNGQP